MIDKMNQMIIDIINLVWILRPDLDPIVILVVPDIRHPIIFCKGLEMFSILPNDLADMMDMIRI